MIVQHIKPLASLWKIFLRKSNYNSLVEIASLVIQYYKEFNCVPENRLPRKYSPAAFCCYDWQYWSNWRIDTKRLSKIWGARICKKAWQASTQALADGAMPYELLLQHKKNKRFEPEMDSFCCTPLHYAARNGHLTAYQVLNYGNQSNQKSRLWIHDPISHGCTTWSFKYL